MHRQSVLKRRLREQPKASRTVGGSKNGAPEAEEATADKGKGSRKRKRPSPKPETAEPTAKGSADKQGASCGR